MHLEPEWVVSRDHRARQPARSAHRRHLRRRDGQRAGERDVGAAPHRRAAGEGVQPRRKALAIAKIAAAFSSAASPSITTNETSESPTCTPKAPPATATASRLGSVNAAESIPANSELPRSKRRTLSS